MARKRMAKVNSRLLWINCRQRFSAVGYPWNNSAPGLDVSAKKLKVRFVHPRHIDRERQQMACVHLAQRRGKTAERSAGGGSVRYELNVVRPPGWILSRRNKNLFGLQHSQLFKLMFPEWFTANENARFIPAHPAGFPSGEQYGADVISNETL